MAFKISSYQSNPSKSNSSIQQTGNAMLTNIDLLKKFKNLILQGAPGTGKTYITTELALQLCNVTEYDRIKDDSSIIDKHEAFKEAYKELAKDGQVVFTTFHQSLDYEEFVEGLKPDKNNPGNFVPTDGIFKQICEAATNDFDKTEGEGKPYLLIIDEINRANVSKVLGELITLLEPSKRLGESDEYQVKLPYSGKMFGVPSNLYVIGTMNTTDRSLGNLDYAIRRRFVFKTLEADKNLISDDKAQNCFEKIEELIRTCKDDDFETNEIMVGHSYFLGEDFDSKLESQIIPLLLEYFKDGLLIDKKKEIFKDSSKSKFDQLKEYLDEKSK